MVFQVHACVTIVHDSIGILNGCESVDCIHLRWSGDDTTTLASYNDPTTVKYMNIHAHAEELHVSPI
jgi:hypothetical protein